MTKIHFHLIYSVSLGSEKTLYDQASSILGSFLTRYILSRAITSPIFWLGLQKTSLEQFSNSSRGLAAVSGIRG